MKKNWKLFAELFETRKENWSLFKVKGPHDISDFESWAIVQAFERLLKSEHGRNNWYWCEGWLCQEVYKGDEHVATYALAITENGNLIMTKQDGEYEQVGQWVVKMK